MNNRKKSSSNFLMQGSILAAASIISRIIGLLYRVPMTAILGDVGNNYYSCAFEIYNMLLLISSFSLPLSVSKLVSARVAKGEKRNAYRVVKGALLFALITGTAAGILMFFGAEYITGTLLKTPMSIFALKVLAPTLLVVAVLGVLRGFFQGLGTMMPSAVSQITEQLINAVISVGAAYYLFSYGGRIGAVLGDAQKYSAAYGAAGGTLGTSMGACVGLLFVGFVFLTYRRVFKKQMRRDVPATVESYPSLFVIMLMTIVPVLLSTTIYNISSILDQGIFKNIVLYMGHSSDDIDVWWGVFSGKYKLMINVPISIASAMAASCVPSLTAAFAGGHIKEVRKQISSATRFVMVIAFPCAVGMGTLAGPIMRLLFSDDSVLAERMMQVGAVSILLYSLSTLTNGLLQGINQMKVPVKNAFLSLFLHVIMLLVLLLAFDLNIYAVIYANAFFALMMCFLNGLALKKHSGYRLNYFKTFIVPAASSAVMGVSVFFLYQAVYDLTSSLLFGIIVSVIIGASIYGTLLIVCKGLTEKELYRFPKGRFLVAIAKKLHILK